MSRDPKRSFVTALRRADLSTVDGIRRRGFRTGRGPAGPSSKAVARRKAVEAPAPRKVRRAKKVAA